MSGVNMITLLGPTASGKTRLGAHLAYHMNGEIISADSRQVYRKMNLGTGKDYKDYWVQGVKVPCHLVDIHDPGYRYNVYEFYKDFLEAYQLITSEDRLPVLVGGTGLYIQAVLDQYQLIHVPVNENLRKRLEEKTQAELVAILKKQRTDLHNTTDLFHRKRTIRAIEIAEYYEDHLESKPEFPEIHSLTFGINPDRTTRRENISLRLRNRLREGLIEEVSELLKTISADDLIYYGLEYKMVTLYLVGELTYNEMIEKLEFAIHQFAKRQMTWFRRMEKSGIVIHWIDGQWPMEVKLGHIRKIIGIKDQKLFNQWKK
jgi:tRNA dimethylallyltransferase